MEQAPDKQGNKPAKKPTKVKNKLMRNALNLLSRAGWSVVSSFSCLVPHGICEPWQHSEESGKLESGWHMKSFLKCHCLWHEGSFQHLCLPSGLFSNRCSRWTSLTAFLASMRPTHRQSGMPDDREEGGFAHASRTSGIFVNEQQGPALLQKEILSSLICCHRGTGSTKGSGFPAALSCHVKTTAFSGQKTTLNRKTKCCSWDWKSAAALEWFMCPKPCSDLTDLSSGED